MKIAFASEHPNKISAFSGVPCYMFQALHAAAESLIYIETPDYDLETVLHNRDKGILELQAAGEYLSTQLKNLDIDVVICQGSAMIPFLRTDKPVVLWHDSTWFGAMQLGFEEFKTRYPLLYEWDCMVLERCDQILFAADWLRDQTLRYYKTAPHKVHTVPFGANMLPHSTDVVETFIRDRRQNPCQITFLGVDWRRKGLPLAYEVCTKLNERGVRASLNVIGCEVEKIGARRKIKHYTGYQRFTANEIFQLRFHKDGMVNNLGFLRKEKPDEYARLHEALRSSHFLLHPASFECFGIALVEANAYGVPVIATDSYGPKTIIQSGKNGYLFNQREYVERACTFIQKQMEDYEHYQALALQSRLEQQNRLDWSKSVQRLCEILSLHGILPIQAEGAHV